MVSKSQNFALFDHHFQMEPLLPGEHRLGPLLEQAHDLIRRADQLSGLCQPGALGGLRRLLRAMNSYYSNKIEGQHTLPLEIEQALRNDYARDADKARRQRLALAHMDTEQQLEVLWPQWDTARVWSPQTVQDIHQDLFARLPRADLAIPPSELPDGAAPAWLRPGELRQQQVSVGRHAAPAAEHLPAFLARWSQVYAHVRRGEMQVVAMAAAHQRLAWIHPFRDGNGRVARLHSQLVLGHLGLTNGLWSPLRGFARSHDAYYARLAAADEPRAGDLDGRGNLTERGLEQWISYVLALCQDQVDFMAGALALDSMKDRMAACLNYEEHVVKAGVRAQALRALHYLFATQGELDRNDFKAMLGLGERLATAQVSALLKRGLLESDSPHGRLRLGVPQHALRFYFPKLWPEAEAQD
ncbi:Fic family protein [Hydrogenophaga sp. PBL-H3]|uniref:Fic family protein n=1 Tax=Hydrogenophaga sp. PBL-H3 TaxID=434010 RepID=UPI00131F4A71|nr:Fic family protein [Hydrogenophaga sp. PBL-H3]QHE78415.1 Fic family protein [Hydrogenophaga sp. PBL-H3]QHE82840.1 Fic family protein [Hydrogenophaga sp. PBL-H3]